MTHKEENIVNIAMMASQLLMEGKMERDDITGHAGLTDTIIALAEQFEKQNAGVDYDAEDRDYWLEIDEFAEKQLLERYGIEQVQENKPLDIKVILDCGIVEGVLKDQHIPVNVEVLDIDPDYEDYEQLDAYRKQLHKDPAFSNCDYTVARFEPEEEIPAFNMDELKNETSPVIPEPVKVFAVAGNAEGALIFSGTWDECEQFCKDNQWSYWDEHNFRWELEIQDPLELELPEGFYLAVDHFSDLLGVDIHNGFVRQHAEELVFCHKNNIDFGDFDFWTRYETLLGDKLSFGDFTALERRFHGDPNDIPLTDKESIQKIRGYLEGCRSERKAVMSLDERITKADDKRISQQQMPLPHKDIENLR